MATYIAAVAPGLGDLVVCLPAIQTAIASGPTVLVIRSPLQEGLAERIPGLAGVLRESDFLRAPLKGDRYINMREHPLQRDHLWGSPAFHAAYPGLSITEVVDRIAYDHGISIDARHWRRLRFEPHRASRDKVLFVPGTAGAVKEWPVQHWLALAQLLQGAGLGCALIGQPERSRAVAELIAHGVPWIRDHGVGEAIDLISSARALVAVDTGLMHVGVHQRIPTVALFRSAFYCRHLPLCYPILAPNCDPRCVAQEFRSVHHKVTDYPDWSEDCAVVHWRSWVCQRSAADRCMARIPAEQVFRQLSAALRAGEQVAASASLQDGAL